VNMITVSMFLLPICFTAALSSHWAQCSKYGCGGTKSSGLCVILYLPVVVAMADARTKSHQNAILLKTG